MAAGHEMTDGGGGALVTVVGAVAGGVVTVVTAIWRLMRIGKRLAALSTRVAEMEQQLVDERAARVALEDSIGARVTAETARAIAALPKPSKAPARAPSGSMPSTAALRDLIEAEVAAAVRATEAEQSAQIQGLLKRVDDAMSVALRALGSG